MYPTSTIYKECPGKAGAMFCCLFVLSKELFVFILNFCPSVLLLVQIAKLFSYVAAREMKSPSQKVKHEINDRMASVTVLSGTKK